MTESEAIEYFNNVTIDKKIGLENITRTTEIINISIKALEKQIPKKAKCYEDKYMHCPCCDEAIGYKWEKYPTETINYDWLKFCWNCGQKIDWYE